MYRIAETYLKLFGGAHPNLTMSPPKMVVIIACPTKIFLSHPCMTERFSIASVDSFFAISYPRKEAKDCLKLIHQGSLYHSITHSIVRQ